jgi:hypothetical protein
MSKQSPNFCALCIPALKMTRNKAPWDPLNVKSSPETPRFHDLSSCFLLRDCHLGYQNIPVLGHAQNIMSVWWWYILSYPIVLWFLLAYRPSIPNVFIDNQPWPSTNPQSSPRNSCASVVSANLPDPVQGTHHVPKMSVEVDWYKCKMQKNSLDKIFKMNLAVFIFICMWTWVCVRGRVGLLHFFCLPTLLYTLTSRSDEHPQSVWATNSMNDKYHQHLDKKTWNVPSPVLPETRSLETETRNGLSNRSLASIPPELISDVHPCSLARLEQFTNNFRKPWPTHSYIYIRIWMIWDALYICRLMIFVHLVASTVLLLSSNHPTGTCLMASLPPGACNIRRSSGDSLTSCHGRHGHGNHDVKIHGEAPWSYLRVYICI